MAVSQKTKNPLSQICFIECLAIYDKEKLTKRNQKTLIQQIELAQYKQPLGTFLF